MSCVQSTAQYEQYEREYRTKYEVYHRLNQRYNEVVRQAMALRAAVDEAAGPEERRRRIHALWQLGANKWKLLEVGGLLLVAAGETAYRELLLRLKLGVDA